LSLGTVAGSEPTVVDPTTPPEFIGLMGRLTSGPTDPAAETECAALDPAACLQRALGLLGEGGGEAKLIRAIGLLRASCFRGLAEGCRNLQQSPVPKAIVQAYPQYTQKAFERRVTGYVVVKCRLPIDGRPRDCRILRSIPELDQEVISTLASARYEPVTIAGVPVQVTFVWKFRFALPGLGPTPPPSDWKPVLYQPLLERCAGAAAPACAEAARLLASNRTMPIAPPDCSVLRATTSG
jgi:TonB family protein